MTDNIHNFDASIIAEFRADGGKVGEGFQGGTLPLLHTTKAKIGQNCINPLAYMADGDRFVIIASKAGAPTNPDWYYTIPIVVLERVR